MLIDDTAPNNTEAEEAVVGAMLIDPECRYRVEDIVHHNDFYDGRLGTIAKACFRMDGDLDYVTLMDRLGRPDWGAYVTGLINRVPTSIHAEHYASIVRRDSVRRQVIVAAGEIAGKAYQETDPDEVLAYANSLVSRLNSGQNNVRDITEVVSTLYDKVQEWGQNPIELDEVRGFDLGLACLNRAVDGIDPGELLGICGRPSTGKSSVAFEVMRRAALRGDNVMIFSLEMTAEAVVSRWASAMSKVETRLVKRGIGDIPAYTHAVVKLSQLGNIWIDDTPGLSPHQIRARVLQKHREVGLDAFAIDHGRKMRLDGNPGENTATIEGRKTAIIKDLCKEAGIAGILVLQLNRALEARQDKMPMLSDLRNSGEHEEELDKCLGVFRQNWVEQRGHEDGVMKLPCLKAREGRAGYVAELWFQPKYQRFTEELVTTNLREVEL